MNTNDTTTDVYSYLTNLQGVRVTDETRAAWKAVREITEQVRPTIERARQVLAGHEAQGEIVRSEIVQGMETLTEISRGDVEQGLWELMQELSGARGLWTAMQELAQLCDPDTLTPADIERAQETLTD